MGIVKRSVMGLSAVALGAALFSGSALADGHQTQG